MRSLIILLTIFFAVESCFTQNELIWSTTYEFEEDAILGDKPQIEIDNDTVSVIDRIRNGGKAALKYLEYNLQGEIIFDSEIGTEISDTVNYGITNFVNDDKGLFYLAKSIEVSFNKYKSSLGAYDKSGNQIWNNELLSPVDTNILKFASLLTLIGLGTVLFIYRNDIVYVGAIKLIDVDCADKVAILEKVYDSDQRIRQMDIEFKEFAIEDHKNQEFVFSIIEKCGIPTLNEVSQKQMDAIWLALQHGEKKYRKKYFPLIERAVENGDLSKEKFAVMTDRMLMDDGELQLYGSQLRKGKVYKLADPESVNERRKEMGLGSIERYLATFDMKFERESDQ